MTTAGPHVLHASTTSLAFPVAELTGPTVLRAKTDQKHAFSAEWESVRLVLNPHLPLSPRQSWRVAGVGGTRGDSHPGGCSCC